MLFVHSLSNNLRYRIKSRRGVWREGTGQLPIRTLLLVATGYADQLKFDGLIDSVGLYDTSSETDTGQTMGVFAVTSSRASLPFYHTRSLFIVPRSRDEASLCIALHLCTTSISALSLSTVPGLVRGRVPPIHQHPNTDMNSCIVATANCIEHFIKLERRCSVDLADIDTSDLVHVEQSLRNSGISTVQR